MEKVDKCNISTIIYKLEKIEKKIDEYDKILFFHLQLLTDLNKRFSLKPKGEE